MKAARSSILQVVPPSVKMWNLTSYTLIAMEEPNSTSEQGETEY